MSKCDLNVERLNKVHKHLWFAGLPQSARALHHQVMTGRQIDITERADFHLVWQGNHMFLKPLPEYLMDHTIWTDFLTTDRTLFEDANGFLLTYLWLICSKSDLMIAHDRGLVSRAVTWERWVAFSNAVLSNIELVTLSNISPRYLYGELRLGRLNTIYRFCSATINFTVFIHGYEYIYHDYSTLLGRNFAWVVTAIIYITIVLTAMQVGLGTSELRDNTAFNRASYGFTIFSMLAPLVILVIAGILTLVLVLFNLHYALGNRSRSRERYPTLFANKRIHRSH